MDREAFDRREFERKWEMRLALVLAMALGFFLGMVTLDRVSAEPDSALAPGAVSMTSPVQLSNTFAEVSGVVKPAVVSIRSETILRERGARRGAPSPLDQFFDQFRFRQPERQQGFGSGVILDSDGYILTNYHVVEGATRIRVQLSGTGETELYEAEVIGFDEDTDLAVIKIDAGRKLPSVRLGNSEAAQVGDWVLAIGSPFGLDASVTAGIISYKGRSGQVFDGDDQFKSYIQTDAAINRGNSGGPLVNMAGEVIGINTAIVSRNGASAGVGFAMPSNTAASVYGQILEHGRVIRGSIGIGFRGSLEEAVLRVYGADHGVLVETVNPGGPADRAGLKPEDVITEINGTPVRTGDDLISRITSTPLGEKVRIGFVREGRTREVSVAVEDFRRIHADRYEATSAETAEAMESEQLGMVLADPSADILSRWRISDDRRGPLVEYVTPGSFADDIGLAQGDLILEVNRERVRTVQEFAAVRKSIEAGGDVAFKVLRSLGRANFQTLYLGGTLKE